MNFDDMHIILDGYLDGELDAASAQAFESHLQGCEACRSRLEAERTLRQGFRSAALYEVAPASLRRQWHTPDPVHHSKVPPKAQPVRWLLPLLAAATILLAIAAFEWFRLDALNGHTSPVIAAAVDSHLRSLQPGHLMDVPSTDQHTVKPWFDGRLDFAPPVRELSNSGFTLQGGRIDVLRGQSVAALVYGLRKHVINVFVWKSSALPSVPAEGEAQGYYWLSWPHGDLTILAVSDASPEALQDLRRVFESQ